MTDYYTGLARSECVINYGVPLGPSLFRGFDLGVKVRKHDAKVRQHDAIARKRDAKSRKCDINIAISHRVFAHSHRVFALLHGLNGTP